MLIEQQLEKLSRELQRISDDAVVRSTELLEEALLDVLKYWAEHFPSRRIQHHSGMGTAGWNCQSISYLDDLVEGDRHRSHYYTPKMETVLQPLIAFNKLFWSIDINQYPSICEGLYNPITRTIEMYDNIIQLPPIDINPR